MLLKNNTETSGENSGSSYGDKVFRDKREETDPVAGSRDDGNSDEAHGRGIGGIATIIPLLGLSHSHPISMCIKITIMTLALDA